MTDSVKLVGLDFGTTTSSAVIASARLVRNAVTGRVQLDQIRESFRSEMVFTPMLSGRLNEARLEAYLDHWLGDLAPEEIFGGGAMLTGLTARQDNAAALMSLIRRRVGGALIASADDPCLESWLAFLGSCGALSCAHPDRYFLNLDLGGGTTNLAMGIRGEVLRTGCLFVGARHVRVRPGTYQIEEISRYARAVFQILDITKDVGASLDENEVARILDFYVMLLEDTVRGRLPERADPVARLHQQVPLCLPEGVGEATITFSGGVGELLYAFMRSGEWPSTTYFGDLGIDLARRIATSPLTKDSRLFSPASGGRATVFGLLRHSTEISGTTLYLPRPEILPLADVPILGTVTLDTAPSQVEAACLLAGRSARGGCLLVSVGGNQAEKVRTLGQVLRQSLRAAAFPDNLPLVLIVRENVGKVLGQYVTDWGAHPWQLLVIDEVAVRDAQFVQVGRLREQVLPVSFFGLR